MPHAQSRASSIEPVQNEAERIAGAYRTAAGGDAWAALVLAIGDALADLADAERRVQQRDRLISKGYVRGSAIRRV